MQCMKYGDVEATLTGTLEIASIPPGTTKDPAGFLRDLSGKVVGKWGWGHPVPFAGYRLGIQSVSKVKFQTSQWVFGSNACYRITDEYQTSRFERRGRLTRSMG
jgi:hypothetical protein